MKNLTMIIEAARWAPTAHNMQNFEIFLVHDERILKTIGNIQVRISETFLRENYNQMSFSKEELLRKKVGVLDTMFPPLWRDPSKLHMLALGSPRPLSETIQGSLSILIVTYDQRKRAPSFAYPYNCNSVGCFDWSDGCLHSHRKKQGEMERSIVNLVRLWIHSQKQKPISVQG